MGIQWVYAWEHGYGGTGHDISWALGMDIEA